MDPHHGLHQLKRSIPDLYFKAGVNLICNVSWDHHQKTTEEAVALRHSLMTVASLWHAPSSLALSACFRGRLVCKASPFTKFMSYKSPAKVQGLGIEGVPFYLILHIASGQLNEWLLQPPLKEEFLDRNSSVVRVLLKNGQMIQAPCKYMSSSIEYKTMCTESDIYSAVICISVRSSRCCAQPFF